MPRPCFAVIVALAATWNTALAADWPQWRGRNRDGVWPEKGLPDRLSAELKARWRKPIGGGYGGIAVTGGRVYVMDRQTRPREVERVVCLDARTGETLWEHAYPVTYGRLDYGNGPRATPTVQREGVYTLGALGQLCCLEAATGKVVWQRDTVKEFKGRVPMWGHACSPLVDGKRLIVQVGGQPDACLVALDRATGKEVWRSLPDPPGYSSPVILDTGKWRLLAYFTPEHVAGLDPETGKVRWKVPFEGITYGVAISDVVYADGVLLASNYWSGSKALRLDDKGLNPKVAWEDTRLSLLMSTPLIKGEHVYALDKSRGLKCLKMRTGEVLWEGVHITPRDRNPQASLVWVGGNRALVLNTLGELVLVELTPGGCKTLGKVPVIGRTWAYPGFADGCVFARNDEEIVCVPLTGK
jgi:outer membrane protein assembly factor BamB